MSWRLFALILLLAWVAPGVARGEDPNPVDSPVWDKVHASTFGGAPMQTATGVVTLETPKRAEDAAIVPIAIRAQFPQSKERYIETIWLIVDNNPSPIAAVFHFTLDSGRADLETRI